MNQWVLDDGRAAFAHGAVVFASLLVYVLVARIGHHRRQPSAAVAWVLLIAMLPYVGLPLFLVFGTRKVIRPARRAQPRRRPPPAAGLVWDGSRPTRGGALWADAVLAAMQMPPAVENQSIDLHADGEASWSALLALIDGAREHLDVATFILADDRIGDALVQALVRAAGRGVRVRLLVDAFGSLRLARRQQAWLTKGGVDIRRFMPVLNNPLRGRSNLRNHRKVVIADGRWLWTGGRNFAIEYFSGGDDAPPWIDLTLTVHGPVAAQARVRFEADWEAAGGRWLTGVDQPVARAAVKQSRRLVQAGSRARAVARLIPSGPDLADDTVYSLLLTGAYQVRERLLAVTPYFVPDDALLLALTMAARRGVDVTLLLPAVSNHALADIARAMALRQLVLAGARVMLVPQMLHAKAIVIDDNFALCGSVNLDGRSLFLNYELMLGLHGADEITWLTRWIEARMAEATPYVWKQPSWPRELLEGMVRAVGYQL